MNCFRHPAYPAVAVCKSCGKGLCSSCAAELPNGIACKNSCEDRVNFINELLDSNARVRAVANDQLRNASLFTLLLGAAFLAFAAWSFSHGIRFMAIFFGAFGGLFVLFSFTRAMSKKYPELSATRPTRKETYEEL